MASSGKIVRTETNSADFVEIVIDKPLVSVAIHNRFYPVSGRGHAKCDPTDAWSEDFGVQLAYSRALARASNRLIKHLVKSKQGV
jgi:hypothetical protein